MKIFPNRQPENEIISSNQRMVADLIEKYGLTREIISERLGVTDRTIYNAEKGENNSNQLHAALRLLIGVLNSQPPEEMSLGARLDQEIKTMKNRLDEIEQHLKGKMVYPPHEAEVSRLNDEAQDEAKQKKNLRDAITEVVEEMVGRKLKDRGNATE